MPDWFFTSDLHGQGALYEQLVALTATRRPRVVVIGGDLCPHAGGVNGVADQRVFLQGFLVEFARRLREASADTELLLMMGNDDWSANQDCLEAHRGRLWQDLHDRVIRIDDVEIGGLSWVPITPFGLKDWERWDDGEAEAPARLDGWVSRTGHLEPFRFDPESRVPTILDALDSLVARCDPERTIFALHSPPQGTRCDMIGAGKHVGSRAIRRFVEQHQPPLVLSGHIHESPRVSTAFHDTIGRSVVVNPGQFGTPRLCGVWFDPAAVVTSLRHTVFS